MWDARWYQIVWLAGYPADPPLTDGGQVAENAWAFLPAYPARGAVDLAGHAVERRVGGGRRGRGTGAALVFHRLVSRFLEPDRALFAVVLFCVAPVSPIMQFGYAESLGFLWLALALLLLVERRYAWLFPVILAWSFTRPGARFALALALHWAWRWFHRGRDLFPVRERVLAASAAVFSGLAGSPWVGIARAAPATCTRTPTRSRGAPPTSATTSSCCSLRGSSRATGGSASRSAPSR